MTGAVLNVDKMLLESGDYLLLESGGKILLGTDTLTLNNGVSGTGFVGQVTIAGWTLVPDDQTPNWLSINDAQSSIWVGVNDAQSATWLPVNTST